MAKTLTVAQIEKVVAYSENLQDEVASFIEKPSTIDKEDAQAFAVKLYTYADAITAASVKV